MGTPNLKRLRKSISSSDFVLWKVYLDEVRFDPLHDYLAQIACEIRRANSKHPNRYKIPHFKLTYKKPKKTSSSQQDVKTQKAFWFAALGMSSKKMEEGE